MTSDEFDREFDLEPMLEAWKIDPKTKELLGRLGSDYDENGIPYWENEGGPVIDSYIERLKYMEENGV